MTCFLCGSDNVSKGKCHECGVVQPIPSEYDTGYDAGLEQAARDNLEFKRNYRILHHKMAPKTVRQMGFQDGYRKFFGEEHPT